MNIWKPQRGQIWIPTSANTKDNYDWITENIAVGMQPPNENTMDQLLQEGVEYFLCLHRKEPSYDINDLNFKQIKLADGELMPFKKVIEGIDFIEEVISQNKKVLVHCEMGISRSAMMVMLYFITHLGLNFTEAFTKVMDKRSIINPNKNLIDYDLLIDLMNYYKNKEMKMK